MKITNAVSIVVYLASLAIGPGAAAQQWDKLSIGDSPLNFRPGGKAAVEEHHFMTEGNLLGGYGQAYYGVFVVEPKVSELTIYLDRLGPKPSGVTRNLTLDERNLEGRDARNFDYIECRYDACANYQMGDVARCAAFMLDENATRDQWRPAAYDRLQGFFCTTQQAPITADMIDRVLADLTVRARK
ncbi:MAG: hypothetical protein GKS02_06165 [Alphaproteobacteria bacterium]|nr:hypothetical protein [Alphaproteobacteria bacterium]